MRFEAKSPFKSDEKQPLKEAVEAPGRDGIMAYERVIEPGSTTESLLDGHTRAEAWRTNSVRPRHVEQRVGPIHRSGPRVAIVHEWLDTFAGSERVLEQLLALLSRRRSFCRRRFHG